MAIFQIFMASSLSPLAPVRLLLLGLALDSIVRVRSQDNWNVTYEDVGQEDYRLTMEWDHNPVLSLVIDSGVYKPGSSGWMAGKCSVTDANAPKAPTDGLPYWYPRFYPKPVPAEVTTKTGVHFASVDWQPCGHKDVQICHAESHYDFHMYYEPLETMQSLKCMNPSPTCKLTDLGSSWMQKSYDSSELIEDQNAKFFRLMKGNLPVSYDKDGALTNLDFCVDQSSAMPESGIHYGDKADTLQEWKQPVSIMGSHDCQLTFFEPMISWKWIRGGIYGSNGNTWPKWESGEITYDEKNFHPLPTSWSVEVSDTCKTVSGGNDCHIKIVVHGKRCDASSGCGEPPRDCGTQKDCSSNKVVGILPQETTDLESTSAPLATASTTTLGDSTTLQSSTTSSLSISSVSTQLSSTIDTTTLQSFTSPSLSTQQSSTTYTTSSTAVSLSTGETTDLESTGAPLATASTTTVGGSTTLQSFTTSSLSTQQSSLSPQGSSTTDTATLQSFTTSSSLSTRESSTTSSTKSSTAASSPTSSQQSFASGTTQSFTSGTTMTLPLSTQLSSTIAQSSTTASTSTAQQSSTTQQSNMFAYETLSFTKNLTTNLFTTVISGSRDMSMILQEEYSISAVYMAVGRPLQFALTKYLGIETTGSVVAITGMAYVDEENLRQLQGSVSEESYEFLGEEERQNEGVIAQRDRHRRLQIVKRIRFTYDIGLSNDAVSSGILDTNVMEKLDFEGDADRGLLFRGVFVQEMQRAQVASPGMTGTEAVLNGINAGQIIDGREIVNDPLPNSTSHVSSTATSVPQPSSTSPPPTTTLTVSQGNVPDGSVASSSVMMASTSTSQQSSTMLQSFPTSSLSMWQSSATSQASSTARHSSSTQQSVVSDYETLAFTKNLTKHSLAVVVSGSHDMSMTLQEEYSILAVYMAIGRPKQLALAKYLGIEATGSIVAVTGMAYVDDKIPRQLQGSVPKVSNQFLGNDARRLQVVKTIRFSYDIGLSSDTVSSGISDAYVLEKLDFEGDADRGESFRGVFVQEMQRAQIASSGTTSTEAVLRGVSAGQIIYGSEIVNRSNSSFTSQSPTTPAPVNTTASKAVVDQENSKSAVLSGAFPLWICALVRILSQH